MAAQVLVVEDNSLDAKLIVEGVARSATAPGVTVVGDGEQALALLRGQDSHREALQASLILLDWGLPRISGAEVLAQIRVDERLKLIPVVILTASEAEQDIRTAYRLQANCFVTKPSARTSW